MRVIKEVTQILVGGLLVALMIVVIMGLIVFLEPSDIH